MASVGTLAERFETPSLRHHRAVTLNLTLPCLLFVTFYAVLANIPYWVASHTFGFSPLGWFCVDYTFVGLVALVVPRFVSAVLILITIFIDLLCGVCMSYFLPVHECLESLGVAHELSARLVAILRLWSCYLRWERPDVPFCYPQVHGQRSRGGTRRCASLDPRF